MARTQKNKATSYHLGQLKAKLAKLKRELLIPSAGSGGGGGGMYIHSYTHTLFGHYGLTHIYTRSWFRCRQNRCGSCGFRWFPFRRQIYAHVQTYRHSL